MQGGQQDADVASEDASLRRMPRHLVIAGTGRAGTSFLVRYLTELGLDTHLSRNASAFLDADANAGLEDLPISPSPEALPYVIKSPWLYQMIDQVVAEGRLAFDAVLIPIRNLVEAASSRVIVELRARHAAAPFLADQASTWSDWAHTAGGVTFPLNPIDQGRTIAVGFHRLVETLVKADVPIVFLDFPRIVTDADYLFGKIRPLIASSVDIESARAAHARVARSDNVRVSSEFADADAPPRTQGPIYAYPTLEQLDGVALKRELKKLRERLASAEASERQARSEIERAGAEHRRATEELARATQDLGEERRCRAISDGELQAIHSDYTWRYTEPFRRLAKYRKGESP